MLIAIYKFLDITLFIAKLLLKLFSQKFFKKSFKIKILNNKTCRFLKLFIKS